jgi:beta-glucanase (GH16 family)
MKLRPCAFLLLFLPAMTSFASDPVWQDDFNQPLGSGPDPTRWTYELGDNGWGNAELETYTDSRQNSFVAADPDATDGKVLVIRAQRDPAAKGGYTSARIITQGRFSTTFGRIEARMKLPRGQGVWPAFWMLADSITTLHWPACGEIDIMEVPGHEPGKLHGTIHGPGYSGQHGITKSTTLPPGASLSDAYHVYAVEWSPGKIEWLLDGRVFHTCTPASLPAGTKWVFDNGPFYLLLNLAIGGHWPGYPDATTTFPQELRIDYVRVYPLSK